MLINNFSVNLSDDRPLTEIVAHHLRISINKIRSVNIIRKAIDARRRNGSPIKFVYNLDVALIDDIPTKPKPFTLPKFNFHSDLRPIVVGFGPAGMFAALTLAKAGLNPLIFERGADVDSRQIAVDKFFTTGVLDPESNIQFGEGGAGTFSDGKLTTRINDDLISTVLDTFIAAGAPPEIRYLHKPHIGTDNLKKVVKNIRQRIISLGGEIFFNSKMTDLEITNGKVAAIIVNNDLRYPTNSLFLAIGHSARDTYQMLFNRGVPMAPKAFAIGVRIEHPQSFIDKSQYGIDWTNPKLPAADYFLTFNDTANHRSAYTFCMCPGGQVIAATSDLNRVVTNGMSYFNRDSGVANSAILVNVTPADFADFGSDPLSGVRFQSAIESLAFSSAGNNYSAPVQTVGDFLNARYGSTHFLTKPTYPAGFKAVDLHNCLPNFVTKTLANALTFFNSKLPYFADEGAPLTGVETRTSAPCRILRNNVKGMYPIGEGAGYAGGIMSSAVDDMKAATAPLKFNSHFADSD